MKHHLLTLYFNTLILRHLKQHIDLVWLADHHAEPTALYNSKYADWISLFWFLLFCKLKKDRLLRCFLTHSQRKMNLFSLVTFLSNGTI